MIGDKEEGEMTTKIKLCFHPNHLGASVDDHPLNLIIRALSLKFGKPNEWADKYGTDYEDDIIMIRRYCDCVDDDCPCLTIGERRPEIMFSPINHPKWVTDALFWHKPSGFKMCWYKYIGRDIEINMEPPQDILQLVTEDDIRRVIEAAEESQRRFNNMIELLNNK